MSGEERVRWQCLHRLLHKDDGPPGSSNLEHISWIFLELYSSQWVQLGNEEEVRYYPHKSVFFSGRCSIKDLKSQVPVVPV